MRERVFQFGGRSALVGIVCDPNGKFSSRGATALVLINSGVVHRVGPNRVYVNIARQLAAAGMLSMRFDLSGVGDSEPRTDSVPFEERSTIEIRQAMDFLEQLAGIRRFILSGICSGADNALEVASVDSRVIGVVLVDFYSVPSAAYLVHSYKRRLSNMRSWGKLLTGKSELWTAIRSKLASSPTTPSGDEQPEQAESLNGFGSKDKCIEKFRCLGTRGTQLCLIYSGGSPAYHNYRVLFRDVLESQEFRGKHEVVHYEAADHQFTTLHQQRELIRKVHDCICEFVEFDGVDQPLPGSAMNSTPPRRRSGAQGSGE